MPSYFILQTGETWIIRIRLFYLMYFEDERLRHLFQERYSVVPDPALREVLNEAVINNDLMSTILIEESFAICIITFVVGYVELLASLDVSISVTRNIFISVCGSGLNISPVAVLCDDESKGMTTKFGICHMIQAQTYPVIDHIIKRKHYFSPTSGYDQLPRVLLEVATIPAIAFERAIFANWIIKFFSSNLIHDILGIIRPSVRKFLVLVAVEKIVHVVLEE